MASGATTAFLPAGQWLVSHDLSACADGTAAGAVALIRSARCQGVLAKWCNGATEYTPGGVRALLPACQAAGVSLGLYGYFYPGDGTAAAAVAASGLALTGNKEFCLDCEIEFDQAADPVGAAGTLLTAVAGAVAGVRPWFTSWGWPDQHNRFPWGRMVQGCGAFAPQVYPQLLWGKGTPAAGWTDTCWNRAAIGTAGGGPAFTADGPAGWEALGAAVVPIFDTSDIARCAGLAHNAGFPAVCWWSLDGLTAAQAAQLAQTPYAAPAPAPAPAVPDIAAALASLAQAETALAAARTALGG